MRNPACMSLKEITREITRNEVRNEVLTEVHQKRCRHANLTVDRGRCVDCGKWFRIYSEEDGA